VLKNNDLIFRNIELNTFFSEANTHEQLINDWLFTFILRMNQYLHLFIINSFCCSSFKQFYLFPEGVRIIEKLVLRTPVDNTLIIFVQYQEASRRTTAEQKDSSLEALIIYMIKSPFILEL
jgi:hypothetical protein